MRWILLSWCRIDRSTCWPAVQCATTIPWTVTPRNTADELNLGPIITTLMHFLLDWSIQIMHYWDWLTFPCAEVVHSWYTWSSCPSNQHSWIWRPRIVCQICWWESPPTTIKQGIKQTARCIFIATNNQLLHEKSPVTGDAIKIFLFQLWKYQRNYHMSRYT